MRYTIMVMTVLLCLLAGSQARAQDSLVVYGAGGTFPSPIYVWWSLQYGREHSTRVLYDAIGSGEGIARIRSRAVDFGASDVPLSAADLSRSGLIQFPTLLDGVVPVVHVPGIPHGRLRLTGPVLADIFLGKVRRWNDPALAALNPNLALPDLPIAVVHRIKRSGTTWIFTHYLSQVSRPWRKRLGNHARIDWPVGTGAAGNGGVIDAVAATAGAIGYCTYADVRQSHSDYALLKNRDGVFVRPGREGFRAAADGAHWSDGDDRLVMTDKPGRETWPIVGATFILMHRVQHDPELARETLRFFDWCYREGGRFAEQLDYVPLPGDLVRHIRLAWRERLRTADGQPLWTPRQAPSAMKSAD